MAYNENGLTKLAALQDLAEQIAADYATKAAMKEVSDRVDGLVTAGGEPNKLEAVLVNGEALPISRRERQTVQTRYNDFAFRGMNRAKEAGL